MGSLCEGETYAYLGDDVKRKHIEQRSSARITGSEVEEVGHAYKLTTIYEQ